MTLLKTSMFFLNVARLFTCLESSRSGASVGTEAQAFMNSFHFCSACSRSVAVLASCGRTVSTAVRVRSAASFKPTPIDDIKKVERRVNDTAWWLADPFMMRPRDSLEDCRINWITACRRSSLFLLLSLSSKTTGRASLRTDCRIPASVDSPTG